MQVSMFISKIDIDTSDLSVKQKNKHMICCGGIVIYIAQLNIYLTFLTDINLKYTQLWLGWW